MKARIEIQLVEGSLPQRQPLAEPGAGAVLVFEGVVRPTEAEEPIAALEYQTYEPMTTRELSRLAERVAAEYELLALEVEHSWGRIAVGETSFRLTVHSAHRKEGLRAADQFIDQMKRDVPLWKLAVTKENG